MIAAYIHRLDPFVFQIGDFGIRWYGLSYVAGFIVGGFLVQWMLRRMRTALKPEQVWDFVLCVALGTVIGGRLGYALFYDPRLFITTTPVHLFGFDFNIWSLLAINRGGMASHGGIIGIILAGLYFSWSRNIPKLHLLDVASVGAPLGIMFGRIANFINAELLGRVAPEGLPWAVKFPQEIADWHRPEHPMHARIFTDEFHHVEQLAREMNPDLATASVARLHHAIANMAVESDIMAQAAAQILPARHPSQLYEALGEGLILFLVLFFLWRKPRKPGVIAAMFGIVYCITRILGEQFRLPDLHIGFQALGLTRGQWLSIALLAVCFVLLWLWARRPVPKIGGWAQPAVVGVTASEEKT